MKYHFIGIKGSGMSSLAQILFDLGHEVKGSDVKETFFTQKPLEERKINIAEFDINNIDENYTIIVGNAFNEENNIELSYCIENDIKYIRYHEFLQTFIEKHISIAVSGAHGKTSTTGLLSHVLNQINPTSFLIGDGTGSGKKNSKHFVFEACEYRRHFLSYKPNYAIITNIDFDHPDYFSGIEDVTEAFTSFSNQTKKNVIACGDDQNVKKMKTNKDVLTYGFGEDNDIYANNIRTKDGFTIFDLYYYGEKIDELQIPAFGKHQVLNTLAVVYICILEGIEVNKVKEALKTYKGVKRRFTETFISDVVVIDDYAHHPTEIKATIDSVKQKYPNKKLISVFQPHTFTRTKKFIDDFAKSFEGSDKVFLTDIFGSARENSGELTIYDLINKTKNSDHIDLNSIEKLRKFEDSVLLFMGAGDIQKLQNKYEQIKKETLV